MGGPRSPWTERWEDRDAGYVTPCREWTGSRTTQGYGKVLLNGRWWLTHRLVWATANGETELHVLHRCDNPPCGRLDHLFLGTNADNVADKMAKGRHRGLAVGKLTAAEIAAIRTAEGTQREIAARFGVAHSTVGRIRARRIWRHL